ncbi:FxsA family protein [Anaerosalibacter sp. Marseille-P3206]|uniref:FxsA family protein n=1 Tax=Anaerosalibacter sp. Marseille-P3206 TaxID=1871005 RepID=UPI0009862365|nr:FxsA family protein [Anaerosalibacter sp. Marseille-P3206]
MSKILFFIIVTPIIDLYILIKASQNMGFWTTILLIIATGIAGYYLARSEGKVVISSINRQLSQGNIPSDDLLTGLCIIIGGVFLVVPGIVTDIIGITMIFPGTREFYKNYIKRILQNKIRRGNASLFLKW